jgi:uncharacterized membrane protein YkgB
MKSKDLQMALVERTGKIIARYGLVLCLVWIGSIKFLEYEANGIQPSPTIPS